jgi:hypothetical protein
MSFFRKNSWVSLSGASWSLMPTDKQIVRSAESVFRRYESDDLCNYLC